MADDESLRRVLSDDLGATDLRSRSEAAAGGGGGAEDLHAAEESRNCVWEAAGWAVCWAVTAGAFRRDRSMKAREPELTSAAEGWLEERVEMSVARLGRVAAGPSWQVTAPLLQRAVADYRTEVGDGRTASIGVDRQLDALLADSDAQQWTAAARVPPHSSAVSAPEPIVAVDGTTSLQGWLEGWLRSHLELPVGPIDHTATWSALGLDSVTGPLLVMALEEHLHLRLDPALPWQQPTPGHLLDFLTGAGTVT